VRGEDDATAAEAGTLAPLCDFAVSVPRAALAVCCLALSACGGGHPSSAGSIDSALLSKQVAGLFAANGVSGVESPDCTASSTLPGDYDCTARPVLGPCDSKSTGFCRSPLAPTRVWFDCFPSKGKDPYACQLVGAPAGVSVFTTAAQKAAPKHGIWKCLTLNQDEDKIGPFLLATSDPHGPVEQRGEYMTLSAARSVARQLHLALVKDCAS
jgi:hypothetical protein